MAHELSDNIEFVAPPLEGRYFSASRKVRLGDVGVDGCLRPDGVVRYLQDVGVDDWDDTGIASDEVWVVRRTALKLTAQGRWPRLGETVAIGTWCGGYGAAWAERRTTFSVGGTALIEAAALWVPVDRAGRPLRLRDTFFDVYGASCNGRRIPGRLPTPQISPDATARPWTLRRADLDVVGHVNNAALWSVVSELEVTPLAVTVLHHSSVQSSDQVTLWSSDSAFWLVVDGEIRVSGDVHLT